MEPYEKILKGTFTTDDLTKEIQLAKNILTIKNSLEKDAFELEPTRLHNKPFIYKNESLIGQYESYPIKKSGNIIGILECFMDNNHSCIKVYTSQ